MYNITLSHNNVKVTRAFINYHEVGMYLRRYNPNISFQDPSQETTEFFVGSQNEIKVVVNKLNYQSNTIIPSAWTDDFAMFEIFPIGYTEIEQKYREIVEKYSKVGEVYLPRIGIKDHKVSMSQFNIIKFFGIRQLKDDEQLEQIEEEHLINDETYVFGFTLIKKGQ